MAGVYVHIPFCKKACHYCNFHFSTNNSLHQEFVNALLKEVELQHNYLKEDISTIYFGGGTPSILPAENIEQIIQQLHKHFSVDDDSEITLEANPDDITAGKLKQWKHIGINRLSIGIQSFIEEDLRWMNRAHNAMQAFECIALAQDAGFYNLSIDLMYGTPTLSDESWQKNVDVAMALNISHLSCYALTVEPKTALHKMIQSNACPPVEQEKQATHFEMLVQWLNEGGYEHYEISNFAKPGYRSKHNSSYWQSKPYLGLGPSAHSFNGNSRQWNVSNNALYIQSLANNTLSFEKEELTPIHQLNEYIMTSLRTVEGLSLKKIAETFGKDRQDLLLKSIEPHLLRNHLAVEQDHLKTTTKGKAFADSIAADLFVQ